MKAIVAIDTEYGIGKDGHLPWPKSDEDMLWFKNATRDGVVIMGRKTWDSLGGKALPNRVNLVVSRSGEDYFPSVEAAINHARTYYSDKEHWIIGGAEIYRQALPLCDHIYLTKFKKTYNCDTFLDRNLVTDFVQLVSEKQGKDCTFTIWRRI